jgi:hypothetical protein
MRAAQLPEQLRADCFCPTCHNHLVRAECADPWAVCLACKAGHRFFIVPEPPLSVNSGTAASLCFAELSGRSPEAIASFWLSEPAARSMLNGQLAHLLRALVEGRRVRDEPVFSFCPFCGGGLSEYEPGDCYVQGLRCPTDHNWSLRGGYFCTAIGGTLVGLQAEFSDAVLGQSISGWLKGDPLLDRQLHDTIRSVLAAYLLTKKGAPQS